MSANVSEKSTKPEIWAAYKALLEEFQAGPVTASSGNTDLDKLGSSLEHSKTDLIAKFEAAKATIASAADDYVIAQQTLAKRKAEVIAELEQSKTSLQATIDQVRKNWDQEQADVKRTRERETEEYTYELNKKRRSEEETFQAKWHAKFAEIETREATLKEQEGRLAELEKAAKAAPEQQQKAVKEACDSLAKDLKVTHETESKEIRQQLEHQKSMLELKLQNAEVAISARDKQLADLQKQLDGASTQLKDMAVTVIRASSQQNQQNQNQSVTPSQS